VVRRFWGLFRNTEVSPNPEGINWLSVIIHYCRKPCSIICVLVCCNCRMFAHMHVSSDLSNLLSPNNNLPHTNKQKSSDSFFSFLLHSNTSTTLRARTKKKQTTVRPTFPTRQQPSRACQLGPTCHSLPAAVLQLGAAQLLAQASLAPPRIIRRPISSPSAASHSSPSLRKP